MQNLLIKSNDPLSQQNHSIIGRETTPLFENVTPLRIQQTLHDLTTKKGVDGRSTIK